MARTSPTRSDRSAESLGGGGVTSGGHDDLDAAPGSRSAKRRAVRLLLVVFGAGALVGLVVVTGLVGLVRDEDRMRAMVEDVGVFGPLLFVGLMVLLVPLNVPGIAFVLPSTTMFGTSVGIGLSLVGGFLASAVGVVGARRLGRGAFDARMPPRMRRWEQRLAAGGFWAVVVARTFTYLLQPMDWLLGVSSISMRTILTGTFVGLVPPTVVIAMTGGSLLG